MEFELPDLEFEEAQSDQPVHLEVADQDREVWYDQAGRACAIGYIAGGNHWMHWPGLADFKFDHSTHNVTAFPSSIEKIDLIQDTYWRCVLPFVIQIRGWQVLHASAILSERGVFAFCGESGVGKSTTIYGLVQRGYPSWADDAVAFASDDNHYQSLRLPYQIRLLTNSAHYFKQNGNPTPETTKADPSIKAASLEGIFILERQTGDIEPAKVEISRLRADRAFTACLTHAYCFLPNHLEVRSQLASAYLDLVEKVPVYKLTLPEGLEYLPNALDTICNYI